MPIFNLIVFKRHDYIPGRVNDAPLPLLFDYCIPVIKIFSLIIHAWYREAFAAIYIAKQASMLYSKSV